MQRDFLNLEAEPPQQVLADVSARECSSWRGLRAKPWMQARAAPCWNLEVELPWQVLVGLLGYRGGAE